GDDSWTESSPVPASGGGASGFVGPGAVDSPSSGPTMPVCCAGRAHAVTATASPATAVLSCVHVMPEGCASCMPGTLRDSSVRRVHAHRLGGAPVRAGSGWYRHRKRSPYAHARDRHGNAELRPGLDPGEDLLHRRAFARA